MNVLLKSWPFGHFLMLKYRVSSGPKKINNLVFYLGEFRGFKGFCFFPLTVTNMNYLSVNYIYMTVINIIYVIDSLFVAGFNIIQYSVDSTSMTDVGLKREHFRKYRLPKWDYR